MGTGNLLIGQMVNWSIGGAILKFVVICVIRVISGIVIISVMLRQFGHSRLWRHRREAAGQISCGAHLMHRHGNGPSHRLQVPGTQFVIAHLGSRYDCRPGG
jgi:hypothetical protein